MIRFLRFSFLFILTSIFQVIQISAATINAQADGNWNSAATWAGGVIPGVGDDVVILGYDVTIPAGQNITCKSITVTAYPGVFLGAVGRGATIVVSGTSSLEITDDININSNEDATSGLPLEAALYVNDNAETIVRGDVNTSVGGLALDLPTIELDGELTVEGLLDISTGFATIYMNNNAAYYPILNINGTYDFSSGTVSVGTNTTPNRINYGGTGNHTIFQMNYVDLGITTTGTVTLSYDMTTANFFYGSLFIDSGTLDIQTFAIDCIDAGTHNLTMATGTTLKIDGAGANRFPTELTTIDIDANATVEYYGAATRIENQSATTNTTINYGNLLISATPTAVIPEGAINIYGDLTVESASLLNAQNNAINVFDDDRTDKTFTINGAGRIRFTGTNPFCDGFETYSFNASSEVDMNGTNQDIGDPDVDIDFGTLTIRNNGTKTLIGNATIQTACSVADNNTLVLDKSLHGSASNASFTLAGANSVLNVNGTTPFPTNFDYTFNASSLVTLDGTDQNLGNNGVINTAKPNLGILEINGDGTKTLVSNVDAQGTVNVNFNSTTNTLDLVTYNLADSDGSSVFTMQGGTELLVSGSTTANDANFPSNFGTYTLAATSTVNYDKNGAQGVLSTSPSSSIALTYGNLTVSGANQSTDIKKLQGDLEAAQTVQGDITIETGSTFDLQAYQIAVNSTDITIQSNATLAVGGNNGDNTNNIPTGYNSISPASGSTVNYYMEDVQEVADLGYHHLILDGTNADTHIKYLEENTTCGGNLTINDGAQLHLSDNSVVKSLTGSAGILSINDNAKMTVTEDFPTGFTIYSLADNSTVIYNSSNVNADANQTISAQQYGNLECTGGNNSIKTLAGNLTGSKSIAGNLTIDSNTELDTDAYSINATGDGKTITLNDNAILDLGEGVTTSTTTFFNFPNVSISQTHNNEATVDFSGANQNIWCQDGSSNNISGYGNVLINGSGTKTVIGNVNIEGDFTINAGTLDMDTYTINGDGPTSGEILSMASGATMLLGGAVTSTSNNMPNNFDTYTFDANSTINHDRSGDQGILYLEPNSGSDNLIYGNIIVSGSGTKQIAGNIADIAGDVTVATGILDLSDNSFSATGTQTFTLNAGTTLLVGGGDASTSNFPDNFGSYNLNATSTTSYDKNGEQGVYSLSPTSNVALTYGHLLFDGSNNITHTKHLLGALKTGQTIQGNVTVEEGANFDVETYDIALNGTNLTVEGDARLTIGGTLNFPAGYGVIDLQDNSTVEYDLAGDQTLAALDYYHLDLTGGGNKTLNGDASSKGIVDIEDGATFDVGTGYTDIFTFRSVGEGPTETAMLANIADEGTGSITGTDFRVERKLDMTNSPNNLFGWNDWATPLKSQLLRNWKYQNGFEIQMTGFPGSQQPWSIFNSVLTYSAIQAADSLSMNEGWVGATSINQTIDYKKGIRIFYGNLDRTITVLGELNEGALTYDNLEYSACTGCQVGSGLSASDLEQTGWNLIGNPYVAPIDFDEIYNENNGMTFSDLNSSFWVWSNFDKSYSVYNAASGIGNYVGSYTGINSTVYESLIPSGKAFWVKATGASPTITINEYAKNTSGAYFVKSGNNKQVIRLMVTNSNSGKKGALAVVMIEGAENKEDKYDSPLLHSGPTNINIYALTSDNNKMMIAGVPQNSVTAIPVGITVPETGTYEIDGSIVENLGQLSCLMLQDNFNDVMYDLKEQPKFNLTLSDTTSIERFTLVYNEGPTLTHEMQKAGCFDPASGSLTFYVSGNAKANFALTDSLGNLIEEVTQAKNASFDKLTPGTYRMYVTGDAVPCASGYQEFTIEQQELTTADFTLSATDIDLAFDNPEISFINTSEHGVQYQWFINGVLVSTNKDLHHTFLMSGVYEVTLLSSNENGTCIDVISKTITVNNSTGIDEFSSVSNATIVVNSNSINISNINTNEVKTIKLFSVDGKELHQVGNLNSSETIINTKQLSLGVYILELSGNKKKETMKVFLQ